MALSPGMADFLIHAGFQVVDMAIAARKSNHEEQEDPVLKQLEARRVLLDKMLAQMPAGAPVPPRTAPGPRETITKVRPDVAASNRAPTLASTSQTVELVRRNLAKELYRFELDLTGGLRIAKSRCDCGQKHSMGVEALTEELIPMDPRPVYGRILDWLQRHALEFDPAQNAHIPDDYFRSLASELRDFRKEVMGTESRLAMLTPEEQEQVKARAKELLAKGQNSGGA